MTTFVDLFGNEYKRNPNLIDVNFSVQEAAYMADLIKAESYTKEEQTHLVEPLLRRLKHECETDILAFLPSEITFMKDILTFAWPNVSHESFGNKVLHAGAMVKLVDSNKEENLAISREKGTLIRRYDDPINS